MLILWRRHWLLDTSTEGWQPLAKSNFQLQTSADQQIRLQTSRQIKRGWYLFGIRQRSENRRCTGWLRRIGQKELRQGRPMYPIRRRWRVIRLAQSGVVQLTLERVHNPLRLEELWLIRLPTWDAWRRIRRRLSSNSGATPRESRSTLWRQYNKVLNSQARKQSLVSYARWQHLVEGPRITGLPELTCKQALGLHIYRLGEPLCEIEDGHWTAIFPGDGYELAKWAIRGVAMASEIKPDAVLFYGDEDCISPAGERCQPQFKPAWNQELCTTDPHYSQCWFVEGEFWNNWLQSRNQQSLSSWQELVLGLQGLIKEPGQQIGHIPMVLSHRTTGKLPKPVPPDKLQQLIAEKARVQLRPEGLGYELVWPLPAETILSVIIPTRDRLELLQACLASIEAQEPGCRIEIVIADNGSRETKTLTFLEAFEASSSRERRQVVVRTPGPFNYSRINNMAAKQCVGSVLLLLNNDVEFMSPGWGKQLASNALRPEIGCVGAKLLYPDRTIQHAGVILGVGGIAGHAHQDLEVGETGYFRRLSLSQEVSAVTAACLAISRDNWVRLKGLDEDKLAVNYNDVDLCLRAVRLGLRNLYLPQVLGLHHESKSRGRPEGESFIQWRKESAVMKSRWGHLLKKDPAYHPYLSLEAADFSLALHQDAPKVR